MRSVDVNIEYSNALANDYLNNFAKVEQFVEYNPFSPDGWERRYAYLSKRPKLSQAKVAQVLKKYNAALGAGQDTLNNIELLGQPETAVVVTGQQAGLLGGPLYTIYKALTAVQLAKEYSKHLNKPVVPVFWIASEDHDYGEINHFHILDKQGLPKRIRLEADPVGKRSIGSIPVPPEINGVFEELVQSTSDTEFKDELMDFVKTSVRDSDNLADWFGRLLLKWLGFTGLVLVDPMHPELRELEKDLFRQTVDDYAQVNHLLSKAGDALQGLDYPVGVGKDPNNINMFMYHNDDRLALTKTEQGYNLKGTEMTYTREELLSLIESSPEQFSPNVVLRPLTQELLFPTLAYVGGPGEINYFCQYKEIFKLFNLQMPIIYPRANLTLVEGGIEKYLNKYKLTLEDVVYNLGKLRAEFLESSDLIGIDQVFAELQEAVTSAYSKAISQIKGIDPLLDKLGRENLDRVCSQVEWLKSKTQQAHRKENDVTLRQYDKIGNSLLPSGNLQERFLSAIYFYLKYGEQLFKELASLDLLANTTHKMVYLKS